MRIYNTDINYSKTFTIHYQPASFRLVAAINDLDKLKDGDQRKDTHLEWDFLPTEQGTPSFDTALEGDADRLKTAEMKWNFRKRAGFLSKDFQKQGRGITAMAANS